MISERCKTYLPFVLLFVGIFCFYLISMPRIVSLEDDGIFLLSAYFNGISHPPGYPLHSLLGYLFVHLPTGNPAANGHAMSAFFSAFSGVLIFSICKQLISNRTFLPYIAAAAYTFSFTIWSQSIITEVYTLNAFLFLSFLSIAIYIKARFDIINKNSNSFKSTLKRSTFFLGLTSGLALSNHWPLFILGSTGIIYLLIGNYRTLIHYWYYVLVGLLLGLTPYLWLYINSNSDTFIQYYGPIENLSELYSYISREHFNQELDFSPTVTFTDKLQFISFTLKELVSQWGGFNIIFVPLGIIIAFTQYKKQKSIILSLLISYLSTSVLLSVILGYDYNQDARINIVPFFVIAHSIGAIFFAIGVTYILSKVKTASIINFSSVLIFIIILQAFTANFNINYRASYNWTTKYAKHVLDTLKPNSILFVSGDIGTGVIGYWHFIKGYRPDITVIQDDGLVIYGTRLFDPKRTTPEEIEKIKLTYVLGSDKPVYFLNQLLKLGVNDFWLVYEYNKDVADNKQRLQSLSKENQKYLHYIFSDIQFTDKWTQLHLNVLRVKATPYLLNQLLLIDNKKQRNVIIKYILRSTNNLSGATILLKQANEMKEIEKFIPKKDIIRLGWIAYKETDEKEYQAFFLNQLAKIRYEEGNIKRSVQLYRLSASVWKHSSNIAYKKLTIFKSML